MTLKEMQSDMKDLLKVNRSLQVKVEMLIVSDNTKSGRRTREDSGMDTSIINTNIMKGV